MVDPVLPSLTTLPTIASPRLHPPLSPSMRPQAASVPDGSEFASLLRSRMENLAALQNEDSASALAIAAQAAAGVGGAESAPGLLPVMDKTDLAFQTLLAIRAKVLEAYQEIVNLSI